MVNSERHRATPKNFRSVPYIRIALHRVATRGSHPPSPTRPGCGVGPTSTHGEAQAPTAQVGRVRDCGHLGHRGSVRCSGCVRARERLRPHDSPVPRSHARWRVAQCGQACPRAEARCSSAHQRCPRGDLRGSPEAHRRHYPHSRNQGNGPRCEGARRPGGRRAGSG